MRDNEILRIYKFRLDELIEAEKRCEKLEQAMRDIKYEIKSDQQLKEMPLSPFSRGLKKALEIIAKYEGEPE